MFCHKCGREADESAAFCSGCGAALKQDGIAKAAEDVLSIPALDAEPAAAPEAIISHGEAPSRIDPISKKRRLFAVAIPLALIVIIGATVWARAAGPRGEMTSDSTSLEQYDMGEFVFWYPQSWFVESNSKAAALGQTGVLVLTGESGERHGISLGMDEYAEGSDLKDGARQIEIFTFGGTAERIEKTVDGQDALVLSGRTDDGEYCVVAIVQCPTPGHFVDLRFYGTEAEWKSISAESTRILESIRFAEVAVPTDVDENPAPAPEAATGAVYTPEKGSAERTALMDACRAYLGYDGLFVVNTLEVKGERAYADVSPESGGDAAVFFLSNESGTWWVRYCVYSDGGVFNGTGGYLGLYGDGEMPEADYSEMENWLGTQLGSASGSMNASNGPLLIRSASVEQIVVGLEFILEDAEMDEAYRPGGSPQFTYVLGYCEFDLPDGTHLAIENRNAAGTRDGTQELVGLEQGQTVDLVVKVVALEPSTEQLNVYVEILGLR